MRPPDGGGAQNIAVAMGRPTCEEAIELIGEAAKQDPGGQQALRTLRLESAEIDGAKADVVMVGGEQRTPAPIPMEKTDDGWKVAGTANDVTYSSQDEAECVSGGMSAFDEGQADPFWKREGRDDFRDYIVETCRIAVERGLADDAGDQEAFNRIAARVILRMVRSGQIRDPR